MNHHLNGVEIADGEDVGIYVEDVVVLTDEDSTDVGLRLGGSPTADRTPILVFRVRMAREVGQALIAAANRQQGVAPPPRLLRFVNGEQRP